MKREINEKVVDKIRKLLALGNSSNPHEASLAVSHAQRLLAAHNLEMVDIQDKPDSADAIKIETVKMRPKWMRTISAYTASAFGCQAIGGDCVLTFIGVGSDPVVASYTYSFLIAEVQRLAKTYVKNIVENREMHRRSYANGAANSIAVALLKMAKDTPVTPGALVPVRDALIKATTKQLFPEVRTLKSRRTTVLSSAYVQGQQDGANIQIHKGIADGGERFSAALA